MKSEQQFSSKESSVTFSNSCIRYTEPMKSKHVENTSLLRQCHISKGDIKVTIQREITYNVSQLK